MELAPVAGSAVTTSDAIARLFTSPTIEPAWFDSAFLASVPLVKVQSICSDVLATLGAYRDLAPNGTSYKLTFDRGTIQAEAVTDGNGVFTSLGFNRMQSRAAEERLTAILQMEVVPAAFFSDLFLAAVPLETVTAIIGDIKAQYGAFRSIFASVDGTYDVAFAKGRHTTRIYLGPDGKILGLIFQPR
jgi:hypothetical protein